jgi:polar amino acid transport system substrate-binding protein
MPKLGGGIEGFQIDLFTEVGARMKREIVIDAVSFSTLIPACNPAATTSSPRPRP